ncbi:MAG: hypothetical protein CMJ18_04460 [Phycisphaeraceae bacterium]|nr:hypothetical protein [Phycisphaeraceae bacterium]
MSVAGPVVSTYELDDPAEPWRTAAAGITARVMPPYKPLVKQDSLVSCWGRTYALEELFPTAVSSQGQRLLAGPVKLLLKKDGQWLEAKAKNVTFPSLAEDRIEHRGESDVGGLQIRTTGWIEYDGLFRTDLSLSSDEPVTIDGLHLVFAFRPEASIFHHLEARWASEVYERSPTKPGAPVDYPWLPLVWVGNHDVGLTIVTESSDGWSSPQKGAIRFERGAEALSLTMRIISESRELGAPLRLRFGIMATPAKPMPPDRWSIIVGSLPGTRISWTWHNPPAQKYFSYPQPSDFTKTREMVENAHRAGRRIMYYITTSATGIEAKVVKRNFSDWFMAADILKGEEWKTGSGLVGAGACCPASGFADFMAWAVEQVVTHLDVDGLYIDNPGPYWCYNTRHGCAAGGTRTYPFFAVRDLHKRLYTIVKKHKPNGLIWEHTSRTFNPIQLAWVDVYSDGEPWRNAKHYPREKLFRRFSRTYMQITGTGHQVGAVPSYLSSIGVRTDGDWSHWILSRVLPWGQMVWGAHGWLDGTPATAATQARLDFGLGKEQVTFYRPHELPPWFDIGGKPAPGEDLIVCLWQRNGDGALLAVLANWADHPIQARIHEKRLAGHLGPCVMHDALTNAPFAGPFLVSVPANAFRMVRIERKEEGNQ